MSIAQIENNYSIQKSPHSPQSKAILIFVNVDKVAYSEFLINTTMPSALICVRLLLLNPRLVSFTHIVFISGLLLILAV